MDDHNHDVDRIAQDLIERFGELAPSIARELAAISDEVQDDMLRSANVWRNIIEAIERLLSSYGQAQWLSLC